MRAASGQLTLLLGGDLGEPRLALLRVDVLVHKLARAAARLDTAPAIREGARGLARLLLGHLRLARGKGLQVALLEGGEIRGRGGRGTLCKRTGKGAAGVWWFAVAPGRRCGQRCSRGNKTRRAVGANNNHPNDN